MDSQRNTYYTNLMYGTNLDDQFLEASYEIVKAREMYQELNNNTSFQFEHCWNKLRYQPKWLLESSQKKNLKKYKNKTPTSSCPFTPNLINLGEDDDSHDTFVDLERPPGRKAKKERLNKRKSKGCEDDYTNSPFAGLLHEMKEVKKQAQSQRIKMYERTYLQDEAKLAIEQEKVIIEQEKLTYTPPQPFVVLPVPATDTPPATSDAPVPSSDLTPITTSLPSAIIPRMSSQTHRPLTHLQDY
ncbi:hypothetical protein HHK36_013381 [Tetracentron sinense]|uniref:No apical meristem-associated C-terminal domain-containing protein n=1 Tax=Tetracentron sinense TaxID=13715 RepID=A0A834Z8Q6_TETSI|nr:hypothetical protein HHK36_013381 [Tetracentron sinense]